MTYFFGARSRKVRLLRTDCTGSNESDHICELSAFDRKRFKLCPVVVWGYICHFCFSNPKWDGMRGSSHLCFHLLEQETQNKFWWEWYGMHTPRGLADEIDQACQSCSLGYRLKYNLMWTSSIREIEPWNIKKDLRKNLAFMPPFFGVGCSGHAK